MATRTKKAASNGDASASAIEPVVIQRLDRRTAIIPIVGETELIVHQFGEKERTKMREAQTKAVRAKRAPKDPVAEYEASMYLFEDGRHGFPCTGFKSATVGGCRFFEGVTMKSMQTAIHVLGEGPQMLVPIEGEPRMREDTVRLQTGVADLRYRAGYFPWRAELHIVYVANILSLEALVNLVNAGGMGGVGEWRPSAPKTHSGVYGTYRVEESAVVEK